MGTNQKKRNRLSKRKNEKTVPKSAFSQSLRSARELITAGDTEKGLAALNELAAGSRNPIRRAKILLTIGESETRHSRHTEAYAAFSKASLYANQADDPGLTLLAGIGMIRSLLRALRSDEAKTAASQLIADLEAAEKRFAAIQNITPEQMLEQGSIAVPARPPRQAVGLTKIATAFMESGLTDEARSFLLKAIQLSPNGASRARQSLAKLSLASDQPELAERYAREALLMGRFQAKTIAAWQLYLDARARQNLVPILEPDVFAAFQQHARGRIAATSTFSIVRSLRAHGDPAWKAIAAEAAAKPTGDPIITTEIGKLLHADNKLFRADPSEKIAANALRLLRARGCSAQEAVAHAKEYIRFSLEADREPDISRVISIANRRYPTVSVLAIRHAMALGAMMAVKHDFARDWLNALIADAVQAKQSEAWGRATWALARMESVLDNDAQAAIGYMEVAAYADTPSRFKIQAMLRGLHHLGKSGDSSTDIGKLAQNIRSILKGTSDFRILLDAARQLALAGSNFTPLREEAANRGSAIAEQVIAAASTPQEQLAHLEYLARKLYWDLGRSRQLLAGWEMLTDKQKTDYHATGGSTWYEYLSLVFLSLTETERTSEATALASSVLDHETATPEGYVILGSTYADHLIHHGRKDEAFEFYTWIAKEAPTHRKAAKSHYWLGLREFRKGAMYEAKEHAMAVMTCLGGKPSLVDEWEVQAKAEWLFHECDLKNLPKITKGTYSPEYLKAALGKIEADFDRLP